MDLITLALSKKYTNKVVSEAQLAPTSFKVVDVLPATGEIGVIYLVPKANGKDKNIYTEYIWTNDAFEAIGDTEINLQDYATIEYVDSKTVQPDWGQYDETAPDFIKNRTHYSKYVPGELEVGESAAEFAIGNASIPSWDHYPSFDTGVVLEGPSGTKYIVYFDGVEYLLEVEPHGVGAHATLGDWNFSYEGGAENAKYPFLWDSQGIFTKEPGIHEIYISKAEEEIVPLDMKYIDPNGLYDTINEMGVFEKDVEVFSVGYNDTSAATYQPIVDAVFAGKTVEIKLVGNAYTQIFHLGKIYSSMLVFQEIRLDNSPHSNGYHTLQTQYINISFDKDTKQIPLSNKIYPRYVDAAYLAVDQDYENPYMPKYDGSPATKKYVDDSISSAITAAIEGAY